MPNYTLVPNAERSSSSSLASPHKFDRFSKLRCQLKVLNISGNDDGTLTVYLEDSLDGGATWNTLFSFGAIDIAEDAAEVLRQVLDFDDPFGRDVRARWEIEADSGAPAALTITLANNDNDLTFTAVANGDEGNDITVHYLDPDAPDESLSVDVVGSAITINLATDSDVFAAYTTALAGANNDLVFTAADVGTVGNEVTIAYESDEAPGNAFDVDVTGSDIVVTLETTPEVAASATAVCSGSNNDLVYTAATAGVAGNGISVEYVDPAGPGEVLDVTVVGDDISVQLATAPEATATASTSLAGANNDVKYDAQNAGAAGNDISVEYVDPGVSGAALGVEVDGSDITVNLGTDADNFASYTTALAGTNNDIVYTADVFGPSGNSITVTYVDPAANDQNLIIGVVGNAITVNLSTDGAGVITATANDIIAELEDTPAAAALVNVAQADTYGSGVVTAMALQTLSGGDNGGEITSTADAVKAEIESTPAADALVAVSDVGGNDGSGLVTAMVPLSLSGGLTGGAITSTASAVATAVDADPEAGPLVNVTNASANNGSGIVTALAPLSLTGGDDGGAVATTASEVKAGIEADVNADDLVTIANASASNGSGLVTILAEQPLVGGVDRAITTTADQIKAAILASEAASDLVTVTDVEGSDGSGIVSGTEILPLTNGVDADAVYEFGVLVNAK
jgi:hypothetical protein